jgi:hypothetical protein
MALPERAPGYDIAKEEPKKESQANCKMKIAISRLIRGQTTIFKFNEQVIDESHAIYVDGNERRSTDDESGDRLKISCVFCLLVDLNFQEVWTLSQYRIPLINPIEHDDRSLIVYDEQNEHLDTSVEYIECFDRRINDWVAQDQGINCKDHFTGGHQCKQDVFELHWAWIFFFVG